jgi:hypothetical protein
VAAGKGTERVPDVPRVIAMICPWDRSSIVKVVALSLGMTKWTCVLTGRVLNAGWCLGAANASTERKRIRHSRRPMTPNSAGTGRRSILLMAFLFNCNCSSAKVS